MNTEANAYWFYPSEENVLTKNKSSIRIKIPIQQKLDLDFCEHIFKLLYSEL